jgi:hypothetical protein
MRALVIAAAVLAAAGPAHADAEARNGADFVMITARPCDEPMVLEAIKKDGDDPLHYRKAVAEIDGVAYSACWRPLMQRRQNLLRYPDGDSGVIDWSDFKPIKEV